MRERQLPKKVTHRTSGHKRLQIDYTQFDPSEDPPSPRKKCRKVDLKWKPSKTHIAAEKYKTKPLGGPRLVRNKIPVPKNSNTVILVMMTSSLVQPSTSGIITVNATEDETQTAIAALLSVGTDLPPPDAELDENATLVLLVPQVPEAEPAPQKPDDTQTVLIVIGTAVKEETKTNQQESESSNG